MTDLRLTWSLQLDGDRLRIDYTVTNTSGVVVQVVDSLIWANTVMPDVVVIHNDVAENTVAFTRAIVRTNAKLYVPPPGPTFAELHPTTSLTRFAFVRWPLHEWHNFDRVDALRPGATHAILEVGYIDHPDSRLVQHRLHEVPYLAATHTGSQQLVRGERLPLPLH